MLAWVGRGAFLFSVVLKERHAKKMGASEILTFGMGGYTSGDQSCKLLLEDGAYRLVAERTYNSFMGRETETKEENPTAQQVSEFLQAVEDLGAFGWERRYVAAKQDGSDWDLNIKAEGYPELKSRGYGMQPEGFDLFLKALAIIGFWA